MSDTYSNLLGFAKDPESWRGMRQGLTDATNRGIAGVLGAPVDVGAQALNLLIAGGGYVGHKAGLLDSPPDLIDSSRHALSSEWIGNKLQAAGAVSSNRNPPAEMLAGLLMPFGANKIGGLLAKAEAAGGVNLAKSQPFNAATRRQGGALAWHGPDKKNNMDSGLLDGLVSSQRYIDRDIVAKKIRDADFDVKLSPEFDFNGERSRAILDGHHALEAAIRSGNRPNFTELSASDHDAIGLLRRGDVDGFLEVAYHDAPWYRYATKSDIF